MTVDIEGAAFDARWSSFPLSLRVQLVVLVPIYVIYLFLFGTRETLAQNIALDDLSDSEEDLSDEAFEQYESLVIDERDQILIAQIARLEHENTELKKVGILYGAGHMRNTMRFLMGKLNYRIASAEWVKVFDL